MSPFSAARHVGTILFFLLSVSLHALSPDQVAAPLSDRAFFEKLDLDLHGLKHVRAAVQSGDWSRATAELARYYRTRTGRFHYVGDHSPNVDAGRLLRSARPLLNRTGEFDARHWSDDGLFDWPNASIRWKERMYLFESFGRATLLEGGDEIAPALVHLIRSFVHQYHSPANRDSDMWYSMNVGIRMRTGWPVAFLSLLESEHFTDQDILLFLKSVWDQTNYLRHHHSETSNWLTFEMAGLYTSGVVYPEFRDAVEWRKHASRTAVSDMERGWLPDGMTIELSPGYGRYFSNYFFIYDLAEHTGRLDEFHIEDLLAKTEKPFESYLHIMAPDRFAPATNNNRPVSVVEVLTGASRRFPERDDFRWVATGGTEGQQPDFTSTVLPYAGVAALRSGWEQDANMLYFDFGAVGYRHAHQDGLNVMLWAYGRQILFDPGLVGYHYDDPFVNYAVDTFSHNTVIVDNRPQRRIWYDNPHPKRMPYQPQPDFTWRSTDDYDYVSGKYDEAYGLPDVSNAYPYSEGSNFSEGWVYPATHYRRIHFLKPELFLVSDLLEARDDEPHIYDLRWHLDSTEIRSSAADLSLYTADEGKPNLEIVPLHQTGLEVRSTSAQTTPELLGWRVAEADDPRPATTVQHLKSGPEKVHFLTLLVPLKEGQASLVTDVRRIDSHTFEVLLRDGRRLRIDAPEDPEVELKMVLQ